MKINFLTSAEFYKDNQTFIISDDGSATGPDLMAPTLSEWFSPFIWRNSLYVLEQNARIYRLNNKSKFRFEKVFEGVGSIKSIWISVALINLLDLNQLWICRKILRQAPRRSEIFLCYLSIVKPIMALILFYAWNVIFDQMTDLEILKILETLQIIFTSILKLINVDFSGMKVTKKRYSSTISDSSTSSQINSSLFYL